MGNEKQPKDEKEGIAQTGHKTHFTHFGVRENPKLRDTGYQSGNEWIRVGAGRLKLVPKRNDGPHT